MNSKAKFPVIRSLKGEGPLGLGPSCFALRMTILIAVFLLGSVIASAQKIESIYVNLYTDSLKKGTYNYINIDGKLNNGKFTPLDSSEIVFWSSGGKFQGNNLWIDKAFSKESVFIKVVLKSNPSLTKEFTMFIKKNADPERLKTSDEIMNELNNGAKRRKKNN
jgi:hypothetical protein